MDGADREGPVASSGDPDGWDRLDWSMDVPAAPAEPEYRRLPPSRGVAVFRAADGRPVLIATSGDVRDLARRRLAPASEKGAGGVGRHTDYRAVVTRVDAATAGSVFECDLRYLALARCLLPGTYRAALDRWQGWFVAADIASTFPEICKRGTPQLPALRWTPDGPIRVLGPIADKHAAGRLGEILIDLFDLCRYHHILVKAPVATACAYKEMGKCPAPCDGSETMDSYRDRLRRALDAAADLPGWRATIRSRMSDAAAALDFEAAARAKSLLDRSAALDGPAFSRLGDLAAFRLLAAMGGESPGWLRLAMITPRGVRLLADVRAESADGPSLELLAAGAAAAAGDRAENPPLSTHDAETLGLVCSALYSPRSGPLAVRPITPAFGPADIESLLHEARSARPARGTPRKSRSLGSSQAEVPDANAEGDRTLDTLDSQGPPS
ncbi:MAG: hypothetical protein IBJ11_01865 [Phycisphaerales bacterium]|nr:hypothetical protein [Phycisphaerales bacterium]